MAEVLHLFQAVAHGQPVREFDEVTAVENKGFKDCSKGRSGSSRQVLLMDLETLEEFGIAPGRVKENITTRGLNLYELSTGQRLHVGDAVLEVTKECEPCHQMDAIRQGLQESVRGRRGILCRVVESGQVRRGDRIQIVDALAAGKKKTRPMRLRDGRDLRCFSRAALQDGIFEYNLCPPEGGRYTK